MLAYLWIAIGGALGSVGRFWFSGVIGRHVGETFPWGALLVNVSGSFAIGVLAALAEPAGRRFIGPTGRQFFMYGVCGGYTTFSSFSLQTLNLARDGEWLQAGTNVGASVTLCLLSVWLGHVTATAVNQLKGG